jgi:LemA protein
MNISLLIFLAVVIALVIYIVGIYNRLVALKNRVENAFAQIEVQLKRRYDLIPNLVETVKGYLKHESETLTKVTQARNSALAALETLSNNPLSAVAMDGLIKSEGALQSALGGLNVTMEAYPDLKASENMKHLSEELTSTENKISFARQAFNDAVMTYNTYKQSFPQIVVAPTFGHADDAKLLEFEDSKEIAQVPSIKF